MTIKELEKSIKWLSNTNNFKNVSRYSKEYFEHLNKVVKALEQAQKQGKLLNEIKDIVNRPNASYILELKEQPKRYVEIENLIKEIKFDRKI